MNVADPAESWLHAAFEVTTRSSAAVEHRHAG